MHLKKHSFIHSPPKVIVIGKKKMSTTETKDQKQGLQQEQQPSLTRPITEDSLRKWYTFNADKAFKDAILPIRTKFEYELEKATTLKRMICVPVLPTMLEKSILDEVDQQVNHAHAQLSELESVNNKGWRTSDSGIAKHVRAEYDYEFDAIVLFSDKVKIINHLFDIGISSDQYGLTHPEHVRMIYFKADKLDLLPTWFYERYWKHLIKSNHKYHIKFQRAEPWTEQSLQRYYVGENPLNHLDFRAYYSNVSLVDQVAILNQMVEDKVLVPSSEHFISPAALMAGSPSNVRSFYSDANQIHLYPNWFSSRYPLNL